MEQRLDIFNGSEAFYNEPIASVELIIGSLSLASMASVPNILSRMGLSEPVLKGTNNQLLVLKPTVTNRIDISKVSGFMPNETNKSRRIMSYPGDRPNISNA